MAGRLGGGTCCWPGCSEESGWVGLRTCGDCGKSSLSTLTVCLGPLPLSLASSSLGVGEGKTVMSSFLAAAPRWWGMMMLAGCGDVELEEGSRSAETALAGRA